MAVITPPSITALPSAPDPTNRSTFDTLAYPWSAALSPWTSQVNAVATNVSLNAIDADICRDSVTLAMTPFSLSQNSSILAALLKNSPGVTYETKIKRSGLKSEIKKYTSKKNIIALKNLDAGNYSASYRVRLVGSNGTSQSRFSNPTTFKVN